MSRQVVQYDATTAPILLRAGQLTDNGDGTFSLAGAGGAHTVLSGSGAPSSGTGVDGDFYVDTTAHTFYGPKASGTWPSGVSIVGPTGATGATGATGPTGPTGATGAAGSLSAILLLIGMSSSAIYGTDVDPWGTTLVPGSVITY